MYKEDKQWFKNWELERRYQVNVIILCALCIVCNCVGICLLPRRILEVLKAIFPKKERLSHMFILLLPLSTRMMRTLEKILEETYVENSSKMITDHIKTLMYRPPIDNFTSIEIQATEHQVRVISLNCRKKNPNCNIICMCLADFFGHGSIEVPK